MIIRVLLATLLLGSMQPAFACACHDKVKKAQAAQTEQPAPPVEEKSEKETTQSN